MVLPARARRANVQGGPRPVEPLALTKPTPHALSCLRPLRARLAAGPPKRASRRRVAKPPTHLGIGTGTRQRDAYASLSLTHLRRASRGRYRPDRPAVR